MSLPSRFNERTFRFYEPCIAKIVAQYPMVSVFNPRNYDRSLSTFSNRLRDAMTSLAENNWTTSINLSRFKEIYHSLRVATRKNGTVAVGTDTALRNDGITVMPETNEPLDVEYLADRSPFSLLCLLAHERALNRPIRIQCTDVDAKTAETNYDVLLEKQEDGTYILT